MYAGNGAVRTGIPAPDFSDRVYHPEIIAAVKRNKRAAGIFAFFIVPLPFAGFVIYSKASGDMELKAIPHNPCASVCATSTGVEAQIFRQIA